MSHDVRTEIEIPAPPAAVWAVLTDLERWADQMNAALAGRVAVEHQLVPDPKSAEGRRARIEREHPC